MLTEVQLANLKAWGLRANDLVGVTVIDAVEELRAARVALAEKEKALEAVRDELGQVRREREMLTRQLSAFTGNA